MAEIDSTEFYWKAAEFYVLADPRLYGFSDFKNPIKAVKTMAVGVPQFIEGIAVSIAHHLLPNSKWLTRRDQELLLQLNDTILRSRHDGGPFPEVKEEVLDISYSEYARKIDLPYFANAIESGIRQRPFRSVTTVPPEP